MFFQKNDYIETSHCLMLTNTPPLLWDVINIYQHILFEYLLFHYFKFDLNKIYCKREVTPELLEKTSVNIIIFNILFNMFIDDNSFINKSPLFGKILMCITKNEN